MTQSGNIGTILTDSDIITQAYKKAGILSEGESLTAEQAVDGRRILNAVTYELINKGIKLWKRKFATLFLAGSQRIYALGNDARCTETYIKTTLDGDFLSAVSVIDVVDATGMTAGDQLGIMVSNELSWFEILSIDTNEITLTTALGTDVSDGASVFTYTDIIAKPMEVDDVNVKNLQTSSEYIMLRYSRQEYFALSNKTSEGIPYNYYTEKLLDEMRLFIYVTPQNSLHTIELSLTSPLFITDSSADQVDFPLEFSQLIIYSVSNEICLENGVDDITSNRMMTEKNRLYNEATAFDNEEVSIFLSPDLED
jgi:hypothetical protein